MNCFHLCSFLNSLDNNSDGIKVKLFCPKRNFDSIIELKKVYLVSDSSGNDIILLSPDDLINEKFKELDFCMDKDLDTSILTKVHKCREIYKNEKKK